jgi:hypothetical protein
MDQAKPANGSPSMALGHVKASFTVFDALAIINPFSDGLHYGSHGFWMDRVLQCLGVFSFPLRPPHTKKHGMLRDECLGSSTVQFQ